MIRNATAVAAVVLFLVPAVEARASEGRSYHFATSSEGTYQRKAEGSVLLDGTKWRVDYKLAPGEVSDLNAIVSGEHGEWIAVNDSMHSWFRLASKRRIAIDSGLFTYGPAKASNILVALHPEAAGDDRAGAGGPEYRLTFSYRIITTVSGETVRGEVHGEMRIWTDPSRTVESLPWMPLDLHTGVTDVDQAMSRELRGIAAMAWRTETEVSRTLDGGETLKERITRSIDPIETTYIAPDRFQIPVDYRNEEPQYGVAGPVTSRGN